MIPWLILMGVGVVCLWRGLWLWWHRPVAPRWHRQHRHPFDQWSGHPVPYRRRKEEA